jgi:anti-sigma regulatory factor (Ser/Thr protein kinase)
MQHLELILAMGPAAPGAARRALRDWLRERRCEDTALDTASLLVTELVTNAVLHASGPGVCLTVDEVGTSMRVAVRDGSIQVPRRAADAPDGIQTRGRGLFLVEQLSASWGWEPLRDGKRVWFELRCRGLLT